MPISRTAINKYKKPGTEWNTTRVFEKISQARTTQYHKQQPSETLSFLMFFLELTKIAKNSMSSILILFVGRSGSSTATKMNSHETNWKSQPKGWKFTTLSQDSPINDWQFLGLSLLVTSQNVSYHLGSRKVWIPGERPDSEMVFWRLEAIGCDATGNQVEFHGISERLNQNGW